MTGFKPTEEQVAVKDGCASGDNLVIEAGAGSGKTATLVMSAKDMKGRGFYGAFNKAIADEAKEKFPRHVDCRTIHSLAFQAVGKKYRHRLNGPRQSSKEVAAYLGIDSPFILDKGFELMPAQQARLAVDTVERFCNSDADEISERHVPRLNGTTYEQHQYVRRLIAPLAEVMWDDLRTPDGTRFKFSHSHYLKLFAMGRPRLPFDFILLDEAQDTNPVVAGLMLAQTHAQQIAVGDSAQQIYAWRGAVDALKQWPADRRLRLSRSFRFGEEVADEANKWLELLGTDMRITGTGHSTVGPLKDADAVLCRTNGEAVAEVLTEQIAGHRVALVGGGQQIKALAFACADLQKGRRPSHPELVAFQSWDELRDYVTHDSTGHDLRAFVRIIDQRGTDAVIRAMDLLSHETSADVTVSTMHKAKGREWNRVKLGLFEEPTDDKGNPEPVSEEDARLAYVAVTRAKKHLDRGGLDWVDGRVGTKPKEGVA